MRLWTVHPRYLDRQGLTGLWREALLAQAVLRGLTRGYRSHPQLLRFRAQAEPLAAIAAYLRAVHEEAAQRGYHFNVALIPDLPSPALIVETEGQLPRPNSAGNTRSGHIRPCCCSSRTAPSWSASSVISSRSPSSRASRTL